MIKSFDLTTHAKHDSAHCLAPNLFRTIKRGDKKKLKLDIQYEFNKDEILRFVCFEPLDVSDMRLLQALVALAGPSEIILDLDSPSSDAAKELIKILDPKHSALLDESRVVNVNLSNLLAECGLENGGSNRKKAIESLIRLSNVTIIANINKKVWSCHLLSFAMDEINKKIFVALNPRITDAVLGNKRYTTISMEEVRAIKTDAGAILHQRLCAIVDLGKTRAIKEETMIGYIWPKDDNVNTNIKSDNLRQRKTRLKKAIKDISNAGGWKFIENGSGAITVSRSNNKKSEKLFTN